MPYLSNIASRDQPSNEVTPTFIRLHIGQSEFMRGKIPITRIDYKIRILVICFDLVNGTVDVSTSLRKKTLASF